MYGYQFKDYISQPSLKLDMLMYGRGQHNTVKQLSPNWKKKKKELNMWPGTRYEQKLPVQVSGHSLKK